MKNVMKNDASKAAKVRLAKLLGTAIPLAALAVPGTAFAQQAVNTATIGVPAGATDSNAANNSATDTDTVFGDLVATNDDFSSTPVLSSGGSTATVFTNDTLNGLGFANTDVVASITNTGGLTGVSINADGTLTVPASTTPGSYSVTYQICEAANPTNCTTAVATVLVAGVADLQTVKTLVSSTSEPGVGDTVTFQIVVTNNGGDTATNVTLTDSLPAGLTATGNNGFVTVGSYVAGTGVWTIPSLANGASATLTIEGTVDAGTEGSTITNTTTAATSDQTDPGTTGDDLNEAVTVINTIIANDNDFSSASIPSTGGSTATVFGNDTLNGAAFANGDVSASITSDGGLTGVSINADGTIDVPSGATPGSYSVTYQICETADPDNCDTATVTIVVGAVVDLSVTKDNGVTTVTSGDTITYTITVSNTGPDAATGAVLTDTPGTGLTCPTTNPLAFVGDGIPSGSFTFGNLTSGITLGTIPNGGSLIVTYDCTVN